MEQTVFDPGCQFVEAWQGTCSKSTADGSSFCPEHRGLSCASCGAQATRECPQTRGLVCGEPLCDDCDCTKRFLPGGGNDDDPDGASETTSDEAETHHVEVEIHYTAHKEGETAFDARANAAAEAADLLDAIEGKTDGHSVGTSMADT